MYEKAETLALIFSSIFQLDWGEIYKLPWPFDLLTLMLNAQAVFKGENPTLLILEM